MKTNFFFIIFFSSPLCASQALLPSEVPSLKALATQQVAKNIYSKLEDTLAVDEKNNHSFASLDNYLQDATNIPLELFEAIQKQFYSLKKDKLWEFCKNNSQELSNHTDSVWSIAFDPHTPGEFISSSKDKTVRTWKRDNNNLYSSKKSFTSKRWITSIAFDPRTPGQLASGSWDNTVRIWRSKNNGSYTLQKFSDYEGFVGSFASFDPYTSGQLALPSSLKTVRILQLNNNGSHSIRKLSGHTKFVVRVVFDPHTPGQLASASGDNTIRIWQLNNDGSYSSQELFGHKSQVESIAFDPHRPGQLASGSRDKTIRIWKLNSDGLYNSQELTGHTGDLVDIAFDPHTPGQLASTSSDETIRIWQLNNDGSYTSRELSSQPEWFNNTALSPYKRHYGHSIAFDPYTPGQFASTSEDNTIRIWTIPTPQLSLETMTMMCCLLKANQMNKKTKKAYLKKLVKSSAFKTGSNGYWPKSLVLADKQSDSGAGGSSSSHSAQDNSGSSCSVQ